MLLVPSVVAVIVLASWFKALNTLFEFVVRDSTFSLHLMLMAVVVIVDAFLVEGHMT